MRGSPLFSGALFCRPLRCRTMCCGGSLRCGTSASSLFGSSCRGTVLGSQPLCGCGPVFCCTGAYASCSTMRGSGTLCCGRTIMGDTMEALRRAAQEAVFCETILTKSGDNVLLDTLRGAAPVSWSHYPSGDVFDRESGAQWYYHCHEAMPEAQEHGHFHCFVRPDGAQGPIHHLVAIGVDAFGKAIRLFTVNQWVVDDVWADADATVALLDRFDVQMARPSYLVNRWLTAMIVLYRDEIAALIQQRDQILESHTPPAGIETRQDRALEVVSQCTVDLAGRAAELAI